MFVCNVINDGVLYVPVPVVLDRLGTQQLWML